MSPRLPSIRALLSPDDSPDDRLFAYELRLASLRGQSAVVRALLDQIEHAVPHSPAEQPLREQLVEELTRLGVRIFEAAATMATTSDAQDAVPPDSGVHPISVAADRCGQ